MHLSGPVSFINSFTADCAYTMDDYTNACVFKKHKACYVRSERRDLVAILSPWLQKNNNLYYITINKWQQLLDPKKITFFSLHQGFKVCY